MLLPGLNFCSREKRLYRKNLLFRNHAYPYQILELGLLEPKLLFNRNCNWKRGGKTRSMVSEIILKRMPNIDDFEYYWYEQLRMKRIWREKKELILITKGGEMFLNFEPKQMQVVIFDD